MRVVGALLALLGLAAAGTGLWLLTSLGTSGTATFSAEPGAEVVVLDPEVVNRVDEPVEVTATTDGDGEVWAGVARPSDVEALLGESTRTRATGVDVSGWSLTTAETGSEDPADPTALDVWQRASTGQGSVTETIDQAEAPQTLVLAAPEGQTLTSVEMSITDGSWGAWAIGLLVVGLLALAGGVLLLLRSARRRGDRALGDDVDDLDDLDRHDPPTAVMGAATPASRTSRTDRPVSARVEEEDA